MQKNKITVFFNLSKSSRGRQLDTAFNVPKNVQSITPNFKVVEEGTHARIKSIFYSKILSFNPFLINIKKIRNIDTKNIDIIYSYGAFVKNPKINYVLEIDNPACLTYYGVLALYNPIIKNKIKKLLLEERLKKIITISEAAKKGLANLFGQEVEEKTEVVYPYFKNEKSIQNEIEIPSFIFISYNFYIKGGKEILKALKKINGKFKFTMITNLPKEFELISKELNIKVSKNIKRNELLEKIIPKHDIVIHPTYMDSFGIAPYECINSGLAGIGTDVYAIPEFMEHEKNSFLLDSPIKYFNKNFLPNPEFWLLKDIEDYVKKKSFPEVEFKIAQYIQYYIDNPKELKKHKKYSLKIYNSKFSSEIRNKKLEKIFSESI